jgi:hypothetical protein
MLAAMPDDQPKPILSIAALRELRRKLKGPPIPRTEPAKRFDRQRPIPRPKQRWR